MQVRPGVLNQPQYRGGFSWGGLLTRLLDPKTGGPQLLGNLGLALMAMGAPQPSGRSRFEAGLPYLQGAQYAPLLARQQGREDELAEMQLQRERERQSAIGMLSGMAPAPAGLDPRTGVDWNTARPGLLNDRGTLTPQGMGILSRLDPAAAIGLLTQQAEAPRYGSPIEVVGPDGQPMLIQPPMSGATEARQLAGYRPYEKPDVLSSAAEAQRLRLAQAGKPETTVNVGQSEYGTIPPGYQLVRDPATGALSMSPITGGPVAKTEAERAAAQRTQAAIVSQDIDRVKEMVAQSPVTTTGIIGGALRGIRSTTAFDVNQILIGIRANIGFNKLQQLRDQSQTGGALGQVTEREHALLQAVWGSLEQAQSKNQFIYNLDRVQALMDDIVNGGVITQAVRRNPHLTADQLKGLLDTIMPQPDVSRETPAGPGVEPGQASDDEDLFRRYGVPR